MHICVIIMFPKTHTLHIADWQSDFRLQITKKMLTGVVVYSFTALSKRLSGTPNAWKVIQTAAKR
jgi:hypothetical protein